MGRLIFLLLLCGCSELVAGQSNFEKFYRGASGRFDLHEVGQGNVLAPLAYSSTLNVSGISLIDSLGGIISTHAYIIDTFLVRQSLAPAKDHSYVFVGGYRKGLCTSAPSLTVIYPAVGVMDSSGAVLSFKYYELSGPECSNLAGNLHVRDDNSVLVWGRDNRFFALAVDSSLSTLWAKRFQHNGGIQFMKEFPSGDLLAGINMDTAGAVVARMDAMGNLLWTRSYIRPRGMVHDAIVESDSSFIIVGVTDSTTQNAFTPLPSSFQPKLFMMKLDGSGDVQWCKGYDSAPNHWYTPQWSRIERTQDGKYVILATLGTPGFNFFDKPFLMKVDLNGDTLWTRTMGRNNYSYYTRDLLAVSDGGFMFSGIIWGSLPGGNSGLPYIYKTDSLGHFPCWEQTQTVQVSNLFPTDSSVTLHSIDGAVMQPAFITDTVFDPITVYDGCTFTTGIPPFVRNPRSSRIHPNPNPGRFTVEFNDPLQADSFYSVFDLSGKLLYQRPLNTGATKEDVDLGRFGKGTYLLRFTSPQEVWNEKVVVE